MSAKYGSVKVTHPDLRCTAEELPQADDSEPVAWANVDVDDWICRVLVWGKDQADADALAGDIAAALRTIRR